MVSGRVFRKVRGGGGGGILERWEVGEGRSDDLDAMLDRGWLNKFKK